ncbi:hypothetical protein ABGB14_45250 [Nonomuraea sp. B10E15]|uniref:hypothetical protein n=1 Tax=Nonomuraea sp. B10E15 TaxID=3153560 RepID=UPI00325E3AFE
MANSHLTDETAARSAGHEEPDTDRRTRTHWARFLANRWPTALALAMTALPSSGGGEGTGAGAVGVFAQVLPLLPLLYLVVAKLGRRALTWPLLGAGVVSVVGLRMLDVVAISTVYVSIALVVLVWGALDGHLRRTGEFRLQALGWAVFTALALTGLVADPDLGRYVIAAGWLLHGVWDFVHLWRNRTVARSFAEWCGVVDVVVAVQLVVLV